MLQHKYLLLLVACAGLSVGVAIGWAMFHQSEQSNLIAREGGYQLINPILSCDVSEDAPDPQLGSVKDALAAAVSQALVQGKATRVSVYFRNMDAGFWTGINPDDNFIPASLVKLPIMAAYLKAAESDPSILERSLTLASTNYDVDQDIPPRAPLSPGRTYRVSDLLKSMGADSDNNAFAALNAALATSSEDQVFDLFDFFVGDKDTETVSPKEVMYGFRLLYNATYLTHGGSQQALLWLSESTFTDGLVAGVPQGVLVAHKFGERVDSTKTELHDCGIVYYPHSPYGLCVMTEGSDLKTLEGVIASISAAAYQQVAGGALRR